MTELPGAFLEAQPVNATAVSECYSACCIVGAERTAWDVRCGDECVCTRAGMVGRCKEQQRGVLCRRHAANLQHRPPAMNRSESTPLLRFSCSCAYRESTAQRPC